MTLVIVYLNNTGASTQFYKSVNGFQLNFFWRARTFTLLYMDVSVYRGYSDEKNSYTQVFSIGTGEKINRSSMI